MKSRLTAGFAEQYWFTKEKKSYLEEEIRHNSKTVQGFCKLSYTITSCCKGEKFHPVIFLATSCFYYLLYRKEGLIATSKSDREGLRARSYHKVKNFIDLLFTHREYTNTFEGLNKIFLLMQRAFSSVRFELNKTCSLL